MAHVFVSDRGIDIAVVRFPRDTLKAREPEIWIDRQNIPRDAAERARRRLK
jgi:hypothetical protein